jgi:DNA repair protein RadC
MIKLEEFERSSKLSELKAVYKSRTKVSRRKSVRQPQDVVEYLRAVWNKDTLELVEEFVVLCLNGSHQVTGWVKVSTGGFNCAAVDPRVVFAVALQTASSAIIVAHNHPSGSLEPSEKDKVVTQQLREGGKLLGIALLDHIILTRDSSLSFASEGLL